ncbi:S41 family peptidase [Aquimarina sp. W85]|uniref:S41 family peptidase n=1 Tax=Aquimarina rhodophyticola TaxID=3342246 RepID=UPI003670860A
MKKLILTLTLFHFIAIPVAQDYGSLKKINKNLLLRDLELLYQGLDKHHSGMYWYMPKDSVNSAFSNAKMKIKNDLNEIEFFNIIAPLVGLSREDHTNIEFSEETETFLNYEARYLPVNVVFLDKKMYISKQSNLYTKPLLGNEILSINGKNPIQLVYELGELFASDGFIKAVKFSDLNGFSFSKHYFLKYGFINEFVIQVKDSSGKIHMLELESQKFTDFSNSLVNNEKRETQKESLEFKLLNDTIAYLGVHTFSNSLYEQNRVHKKLSTFLEISFKTIVENNVSNLIIDLSNNGGGNEGNENLLFSYLADNYKKYKSVCAKSQVSILDNGIDEPIKLKTFGFFERIFGNDKMPDKSYCRKRNMGFGLMAYKKEPRYKYDGKLFVIISPVTYSGGSEFSNMIKTSNRGIFVGKETGGGYYGNTSGYSSELVLPHSRLLIDIPSLKFEMNVQNGEFGRGIIPDYKVVPTITEYLTKQNIPIKFILNGKASR